MNRVSCPGGVVDTSAATGSSGTLEVIVATGATAAFEPAGAGVPVTMCSGTRVGPFSTAMLESLVGQELGVSDWVEVTQAAVDLFASASGDRQWIHVDVERCRTQSPYGGTIAHGLFTLSLLPAMIASVCQFSDASLVLNYGFNKVRFTAPVPVGVKLRARLLLFSFETTPGHAQLVLLATIEREGESRAVCHAEAVLRLIP